MRVIDIVDGTTVDGPGFRTSIYFAGCLHQCQGCHNPQSWDLKGGVVKTVDQLMSIIDTNDINVSFSGGDPLYQLAELTELARRIKASGKTIWCYTGFVYEDLAGKKSYEALLDYIDVLVDGPFIESLRDTSLLFRGSSNQRLIEISSTRKAGHIIQWQQPF